jgi:hypothetical protein
MPERYTFPFFLSGPICGELDWLCHREMVKLDTHGDLTMKAGSSSIGSLWFYGSTAASTSGSGGSGGGDGPFLCPELLIGDFRCIAAGIFFF